LESLPIFFAPPLLINLVSSFIFTDRVTTVLLPFVVEFCFNDGRGLIISGSTGVGKSWLACAFGAEACHRHRSYSTMYFNAISLFDEIANAITLGEIKDFKKKVCTAKLLIIDDFGLGGFNQSLAPAFLEIIDKQSQSGGLLITSQVPKKLWFEQFQDPTIADAVMDRILHRSYELEILGRSYREKIFSQK
jgi:DNA replication protein DnaC